MCIIVCEYEPTLAIIPMWRAGERFFCTVCIVSINLKSSGKLGNNCPYLLSHVAGKNHVLKTAFALPLQQSFLSISCIYNEHYPATAGWNLSSRFVLVHPVHQHLLSLKPPEAPFGSIIFITGPVNPLPIWALKLGWLSNVSCISSLSKTTKDLPLHLRLSPYSSLA